MDNARSRGHSSSANRGPERTVRLGSRPPHRHRRVRTGRQPGSRRPLGRTPRGRDGDPEQQYAVALLPRRKSPGGEPPDTGAPIEGARAPGWRSVHDRTLDTAAAFPYRPRLGWDIVLADDEDGVRVLEGDVHATTRTLWVHRRRLRDPRVGRFYEYHDHGDARSEIVPGVTPAAPRPPPPSARRRACGETRAACTVRSGCPPRRGGLRNTDAHPRGRGMTGHP